MALLGGAAEFVLSVNHRGKYWREYRFAFGFYLLVGVLLAIGVWLLYGESLALVIALALLCGFALFGEALFSSRRGKLPKPQRDRLGQVARWTTRVALALALVGLLLEAG